MGDYVEFRSAKRLKVRTSRLTRVFKTTEQTPVYLDYPPWTRYVNKSVDKKVTLKTVFYSGGRVLGVIKYRRYAALMGPPFKRRTVVELPNTRAVATLLNGVV